MTRRFSPEVEAAIENASSRYGIPSSRLRSFVGIESGGNPSAVTGSYKGLLQLSSNELAKHGGGDIFNPNDNINAGALKLKAEAEDFKRKYGREPSDGDLYLIHQQGEGGAAAHWANPDKPAWQNMFSTGEGQQKGAGWAKQAIWGNVPDDLKAKFGSVDNITSRDFVDLWNQKVARFGGNVEADKQGSINGGFGMSPTGAAGVSGAIQTATPTPAPTQFKDFQTTTPQTMIASGGGSGDAAGLLASLFGGGEANPFKSLMAEAKPVSLPAAQPAQLANLARPIDVSTLLSIVNKRNQLGSA